MTGKLRATPRAKAAIAAAVAATVAAGGGGVIALYGERVPAAVILAEQTFRPWEGRELVAYLDRLASPPVWTICDGDTLNVRPGMVETPAGCDARTRRRLVHDFYRPLTRCISGFNSRPVSWGGMMISLAWNIGVPAACNSTAARLGREGRYVESCFSATAYNRAGGKVLIGLVRRREMGDATRLGEGEVCVSGLGQP